MRSLLMISAVLLVATGCANTVEKLRSVGKQPPLTEVENPQVAPYYKPMSWPLPDPQPEGVQYANSLWQPGARAFFRDQRASRVGDILRIRIRIDDRAELENNTERTRESTQNVTNPILSGLERFVMPESVPLLAITGSGETSGDGQIEREERIETVVAAVIVQVLPNGNFVIQGSQEVQVNFEVRELSVKGIVRPEDIDSDNTIDSSQIAEARIGYGGRGNITDLQAPRWGEQIIDIIAPF